MSGLDRLVGDVGLLVDHWEHAPFVATGLGDLSDLFGARVAERLVHSAALPVQSVRLFRDGTEVPGWRVSRRRERGSAQRERLVDGAAVEREIAAGATLVLEELQTYLPELASFCREVTERTGSATYCAGFLTPAGARGVAPHYDTASVLIRQVHGSKRWRVGRPAQRWPLREWVPGRDAETENVLDVVLRAGECLYIPRGFVHAGDATAESSIHLSVALVPRTWGSVVRGLLSEALQDEGLREALPYAHHRLDAREFDELLVARIGILQDRLTDPAKRTEPLDGLPGEPPPPPPPMVDGSLLAALTHPRPAARPAPDGHQETT